MQPVRSFWHPAIPSQLDSTIDQLSLSFSASPCQSVLPHLGKDPYFYHSENGRQKLIASETLTSISPLSSLMGKIVVMGKKASTTCC